MKIERTTIAVEGGEVEVIKSTEAFRDHLRSLYGMTYDDYIKSTNREAITFGWEDECEAISELCKDMAGGMKWN